jgi:sensor histidine kinase YesM
MSNKVLIHVLAWVSLIAYHVVTDYFFESSQPILYLDTLVLTAQVYVPSFYLTLWLVFKPLEKNSNWLLFILRLLSVFFIYVLLIFCYYKLVRETYTHTPEIESLRIDLSFIVTVMDTYFLTYFIFALLYWYAQRNLQYREKIRQKELQEHRNRIEMQELEGKALRAQMNPHFIFNSLNSVQDFMLDNDGDSARIYLGRFGELMRQTLENSAHARITLEEEIRYLKTYLDLEKMRTGIPFNYDIDISHDLDPKRLHLPAMLLQPYVENAVKHGMKTQKNGEGLITIHIRPEASALVCIVTDNGPGYADKKDTDADRVGHVSMGTGITRSRIELLNRDQNAGIRLKVAKRDGGGTEVIIVFPFTFVKQKLPS